MNINKLSAGQLRRAAEIKDQIEALDREYLRILGFGIPEIKPKLKPPQRRKHSKKTKRLVGKRTGGRWELSRKCGSKKLLSNKEIEKRLKAMEEKA